MFLQVGKKLINTDWIVVAEFAEAGDRPSLHLRLAGGGYRESTITHEQFDGETARQLWAILQRDAELVTETDESEAGGDAETGPMRW